MSDVRREVEIALAVTGASEASEQLREVSSSTTTTSDSSVQLTLDLAKVGEILVDVAIKAYNYAKSIIDSAGATYDMSVQLDILPSQLSALGLYLEQDGSSVQAFSGGLNIMNGLLDDAREGSQQAADKLARVGLSIDDVRNMSPEELFYAISDGMQSVADHGERMAIASDLFGRRMGAGLLPTLERGGDALRNAGSDMSDLNRVMSEDSYEAMDAFGDKLLEAQAQLESSFGEAVAEVLPLLVSMIDSGLELAQNAIPALAGAFSAAGPEIEIVGTIVSRVAQNLINMQENINYILGYREEAASTPIISGTIYAEGLAHGVNKLGDQAEEAGIFDARTRYMIDLNEKAAEYEQHMLNADSMLSTFSGASSNTSEKTMTQEMQLQLTLSNQIRASRAASAQRSLADERKITLELKQQALEAINAARAFREQVFDKEQNADPMVQRMRMLAGAVSEVRDAFSDMAVQAVMDFGNMDEFFSNMIKQWEAQLVKLGASKLFDFLLPGAGSLLGKFL